MGPILSFIVLLIVAALVLMVVSRFNLGLEVAGFVPAIISALVIGIVGAIVIWLLGLFGLTVSMGSWLSALGALVVAAVVLILSARFVPGLKVNGFVGAIVAAIAIAVVYWIIGSSLNKVRQHAKLPRISEWGVSVALILGMSRIISLFAPGLVPNL